jgi:hypothetical protein
LWNVVASPWRLIREVGGEGGCNEHQERDGPADVAIAGPEVEAQGTEEVEDEANPGGGTEPGSGQPDQEPESA